MADFRDALNAYGAKNDPAMARSSNANQYADLPNPRRAAEIVAEARQRVAASGGNPQHLQAMIQRVSDEFAQRDQMDQRGDSGGYQQPNNIDAYIDRVLQMSGMIGGPSASAGTQASGGTTAGGAGDNSQYAAPVDPVERGSPLPDAEPNPDNDDDGVDEAGNPSNWKEYAAWVAAGGTAYAAYKFLQKYKRPPTQADVGNIGGDPNSDRVAAAHGDAPRTAVDESIDAIEGDSAKRPRPAPPQQQIEGPRAALPKPDDFVDYNGDPVNHFSRNMSEEDFDQRFGAMVEGQESNVRPGPNRYSRDTPLPDDVPAEVIEQATQRAQSGDIRGAVTLLRENGVDLDDNLLRQLVEGANVFKSLQQRVGDVTGDAIRKGVRGAF